MWVVDEPVADQNSPVKIHVVPDDNIPRLLWSTPLLGWNEDAMLCVQECDEKGGVVGTKVGMMMEDIAGQRLRTW